MQISGLHSLPQEILIHTLSFLNSEGKQQPSRDLLNVKAVCKQLKTIIDEKVCLDYGTKLKVLETRVNKLKSAHTKAHVETIFCRLCVQAGEYLDLRYRNGQSLLIRYPLIAGLYLLRPYINLAGIIENIVKLIWIRLASFDRDVRQELAQLCRLRLIKHVSLLFTNFVEFGPTLMFYLSSIKLPNPTTRQEHYFRQQCFNINEMAQDPHQFAFFGGYSNTRKNIASALLYFQHYLLDVSEDPLTKEAYQVHGCFIGLNMLERLTVNTGRWSIYCKSLNSTAENPMISYQELYKNRTNHTAKKVGEIMLEIKLNGKELIHRISAEDADLILYLLA